MADIQNPRLLYVKGGLMLLTGLLASALLLADRPSLRSTILLAVAVWGFARAYYFAFYVVEHYIDPAYRYAGLLDFLRHHRRRPKSENSTPPTHEGPAQLSESDRAS